jgi:hypothetical protein
MAGTDTQQYLLSAFQAITVPNPSEETVYIECRVFDSAMGDSEVWLGHDSSNEPWAFADPGVRSPGFKIPVEVRSTSKVTSVSIRRTGVSSTPFDLSGLSGDGSTITQFPDCVSLRLGNDWLGEDGFAGALMAAADAVTFSPSVQAGPATLLFSLQARPYTGVNATHEWVELLSNLSAAGLTATGSLAETSELDGLVEPKSSGPHGTTLTTSLISAHDLDAALAAFALPERAVLARSGVNAIGATGWEGDEGGSGLPDWSVTHRWLEYRLCVQNWPVYASVGVGRVGLVPSNIVRVRDWRDASETAMQLRDYRVPGSIVTWRETLIDNPRAFEKVLALSNVARVSGVLCTHATPLVRTSLTNSSRLPESIRDTVCTQLALQQMLSFTSSTDARGGLSVEGVDTAEAFNLAFPSEAVRNNTLVVWQYFQQPPA